MKDETCANCAHFKTKRYINGKLIHRADSVALCSLKKDEVSDWSRCDKFAPCKEYQELLNKEIEEKYKKELIKQERDLKKQHEKELEQVNEANYEQKENEPIDYSGAIEFLSANADKFSEMIKKDKQKNKNLGIICIVFLLIGILGFALIFATKGNGFCIALAAIGSGVFVITLAALLIKKYGK